MRTGFVWHERFMWQEAGDPGYGLEIDKYLEPGDQNRGPGPKRRIRNLLEVSGLLDQLTPIGPRLATFDEITRVHDEHYVRRVERDCDAGGGSAGPSTPLARDSYEIARLAAGGVLEAVDAVLRRDIDNAYALVRPPGHHALTDQGLGLCILGNVAIAAQHLRQARALDRVAVVDWDAHHGNGTQEIFYEDPSVLTISIHQAHDPFIHPLGLADKRGRGAGDGFNVNIPLPPGSGRGAYISAMERVVVPALRQFRPQFILVASGFDASLLDPMARMLLLPDAYREMTQFLLDVADELCEGRLVIAHEGGYSELLTPFCGLSVVAALAGIRSEVESLFRELPFEGWADQELLPHQAAAIDGVVAVHNLGT